MADLKIALVGSEPGSQGLAPCDNPDWKIWTCSPGGLALARIDAFFEIHSLDACALYWDRDFPLADYISALNELEAPIWLAQRDERIPKGQVLPLKPLIEEFGSDFLNSTPAIMCAKAILDGASHIALFGIEMSREGAYSHQRPGMKFFIREAIKRGIKVSAPPDSSILQRGRVYGFGDWDPLWRRKMAQAKVLRDQLASAKAAKAKAEEAIIRLTGALEVIENDIEVFGSAR